MKNVKKYAKKSATGYCNFGSRSSFQVLGTAFFFFLSLRNVTYINLYQHIVHWGLSFSFLEELGGDVYH